MIFMKKKKKILEIFNIRFIKSILSQLGITNIHFLEGLRSRAIINVKN